MTTAQGVRLSRVRPLRVILVVGVFALGIVTGWFLSQATGFDRPISSKPIPVDFCFWVTHKDLFRGQPVETQAQYTQLIEVGAIDKEECQDVDVSHFWPASDDPVRRDWAKDLYADFENAKYEFWFVGTIPAFPRYIHWLSQVRDRWQGPSHPITIFRVDRLIRYKRIP